jgi:hypothetical protein
MQKQECKNKNAKTRMQKQMIFLLFVFAIFSSFQLAKADYENPTDSLDIFNLGQESWQFSQSMCPQCPFDSLGWYDRYNMYDTNGVPINYDYLHTNIKYNNLGNIQVFFRFRRVINNWEELGCGIPNPKPTSLHQSPYIILVDVWKICFILKDQTTNPSLLPQAPEMLVLFQKELIQNMKYYFHSFSQNSNTANWWINKVWSCYSKFTDLIGFRFVFPCTILQSQIPNPAGNGLYSVCYESCNSASFPSCCQYDYVFQTVVAGNNNFCCSNHMELIYRNKQECLATEPQFPTCDLLCVNGINLFAFNIGQEVIKDWRSKKTWCLHCSSYVYLKPAPSNLEDKNTDNIFNKNASIIKVFDILGNLIDEINCKNSDCNYLDSKLKSGVYILQYYNDNGEIIQTKTKLVD